MLAEGKNDTEDQLKAAQAESKAARGDLTALSLVVGAARAFGKGALRSLGSPLSPPGSASSLSSGASLESIDITLPEKAGRSRESKTPEDTAHNHKKQRAAGEFEGDYEIGVSGQRGGPARPDRRSLASCPPPRARRRGHQRGGQHPS